MYDDAPLSVGAPYLFISYFFFLVDLGFNNEKIQTTRMSQTQELVILSDEATARSTSLGTLSGRTFARP